VLVLATIQVATAIVTEATLSFLGVGAPPTSPSLGTLISVGKDFLFSGEWWITVFPGLMLVIISLSVNLLRRLVARRAQSTAALIHSSMSLLQVQNLVVEFPLRTRRAAGTR
jgi:ABC-type dipeptide/oligopeptide/nickel transport system permease subunit